MSDYKENLKSILSMDYSKIFFDILEYGDNKDLTEFLDFMGDNSHRVLVKEMPSHTVRTIHNKMSNDKLQEPIEILINNNKPVDMIITFYDKIKEKKGYSEREDLVKKVYSNNKYYFKNKDNEDINVLKASIEANNLNYVQYFIDKHHLSLTIDMIGCALDKDKELFSLLKNHTYHRLFFDQDLSKSPGIYSLLDSYDLKKSNPVAFENFTSLFTLEMEVRNEKTIFIDQVFYKLANNTKMKLNYIDLLNVPDLAYFKTLKGDTLFDLNKNNPNTLKMLFLAKDFDLAYISPQGKNLIELMEDSKLDRFKYNECYTIVEKKILKNEISKSLIPTLSKNRL